MDLEDDSKESLLSKWGVDSEDAIFERIHIPCGKNIFNVREVIEEENRRIYESQRKEYGEKIENGKEFVEQLFHEDVV